MTTALRIKTIRQVDNHTFGITWHDGVEQFFRLSDLQRQCPCAGCVDENTGQRTADPMAIPDSLTAVRLSNVGRYGLRILFSQGCSNGIYSFEQLRGLGREKVLI